MHTVIMECKGRNSFYAAFKFNAIDLAVTEENRAAARKFSINESMVRCWRRQHEELKGKKRMTA